MSDSNAPHPSSGHHGHSRWHHLIHHAAVATVLALMVVVLETHGWLNWLDTASLRVALAMKNSTSQLLGSGANAAATGAGPVKALLIGDDAFERAFMQESPLSRQVLRELLERIAQQGPRVVAIDIDLSPGPQGARSNLGQEALDAALIRLASSAALTLVVVTPFPVSDDTILDAKFKWMSKLCAAGVRFAYPHIPISQGLALRISPQSPSLGVIAIQAGKGLNPSSADEPCALVRQGPEKAFFLSTLSEAATHAQAGEIDRMIPLNPDAMNQMISSAGVWSGRTDDALAGIKPGDIVFLGASYDPRDTLLTLNGLQPGVIYHAASAQTLMQPTRKVGHAGAFAFDLVLGVLAGYLFGWGWSRYNLAGGRLASGHGSPWRLYLTARFWLALNLVILLAWLLLLFSLSASLLRAQIWASPGAMILGMFVKTLLASRGGHHEGSAHTSVDAGAAATANRFSIMADLLLASPLLLYGAWLTFLAH